MTADSLRQACFFNKIKFLGFHAVGTSTREDSRPFHSCINYYCRTDIDEDRVISFLGLWTDRLTQFRNPHLQFQLEDQNWELASYRSQYASQDDRDA